MAFVYVLEYISHKRFIVGQKFNMTPSKFNKINDMNDSIEKWKILKEVEECYNWLITGRNANIIFYSATLVNLSELERFVS